jgi:hypothetical protein
LEWITALALPWPVGPEYGPGLMEWAKNLARKNLVSVMWRPFAHIQFLVTTHIKKTFP